MLVISMMLAFPAQIAFSQDLPPAPPEIPDTPAWAVYVFLNADNNLDMAGLDDVKEMERGLKNAANIPVVVQIDRARTGAKRLLVTEDSSTTLQDLGEVDMGSADTLIEFLQWAHENYPARRTMLVIWNHGAGWYEGESRLSSGPRGISYDDTSGNHITTFQLRKIMDKACTILGKPLDILGFDACLMNMAEVIWQLGDGVKICVGSEETEPGDGWPYNSILSKLCANPEMSPVELSKIIVSKYTGSYWIPLYNVTQSAIDVAALKEFRDDFNFWVEAMLGLKDYEKQLFSNAWNNAQRFYYNSYADLFHFAKLVRKGILPIIGNKILREATDRVLSWEDRIVIKSSTGGSSMKNARGLSIHIDNLPAHSYYRHLAFAQDTLWDEFLTEFTPLPPPPPPEQGLTAAACSSRQYAPDSSIKEMITELGRRGDSSALKGLAERVRALPPRMLEEAGPILELIEQIRRNLE
jgi:hypothetical protein